MLKFCKHTSHVGENPLPLEQFSKRKLAGDGHQPWCKRCCAFVSRTKREEKAHQLGCHLPRVHHTKLNTPNWARATQTESERLYRARRKLRMTPELKVHLILRIIKQRSRKNDIPFDVTLQNLQPLPSTCPDLKIPLSYNNIRKHEPNSATVDRIIPALGYVPGNVRVISYKANAMKQNASLKEMETVAKSWLRLVKMQKD